MPCPLSQVLDGARGSMSNLSLSNPHGSLIVLPQPSLCPPPFPLPLSLARACARALSRSLSFRLPPLPPLPLPPVPPAHSRVQEVCIGTWELITKIHAYANRKYGTQPGNWKAVPSAVPAPGLSHLWSVAYSVYHEHVIRGIHHQ